MLQLIKEALTGRVVDTLPDGSTRTEERLQMVEANGGAMSF